MREITLWIRPLTLDEQPPILEWGLNRSLRFRYYEYYKHISGIEIDIVDALSEFQALKNYLEEVL